MSLNTTENFTYLGSVISNVVLVNSDLDGCLNKANSSFGHLSIRVWKNHMLQHKTRIQVYTAVIIHTLLYGAETWALYMKQIRLLKWFHQWCLCDIMCIKGQDYVSNEDILQRTYQAQSQFYSSCSCAGLIML